MTDKKFEELVARWDEAMTVLGDISCEFGHLGFRMMLHQDIIKTEIDGHIVRRPGKGIHITAFRPHGAE